MRRCPHVVAIGELVTCESRNDSGEYERVILEEKPEGVYVFVVRRGEDGPFRDHLQDSWELAFQQALEDYGVQRESFIDRGPTGWC